MIDWINIGWGIALLGIATICFVPAKFKSNAAIIAVIANALVTSLLAILALSGQEVSTFLNGGNLIGSIPIRIDSLSAWFILIINFTCITGVIYGSGYLKAYENSTKKLNLHWLLFVTFQLSMVWVCMIQHGLVFLIAWEVMSLSSMMLVIFDAHKPRVLKAGINYLVQMHLSVVFLSMGFIWVYFKTGSFSFEALTTYFGAYDNSWLFLVFFIGFGLKAGFIPLHTWLPHAHPAAPSHISGVMSGVIVKLGIYGLFRIISHLKADYIVLGEIMILVSVLTGLYGILNAAVHRDFKKMLAYCTIENIGIIGIGMGIGLIGLGNNVPLLYYLGFGGALLHVLNHSLFKSLLFFAAGSVYQQTHTRNMEKLGGLIKSMPKTAIIFLIGAIAIGGMPPFNGFISEFLIYSGLLEGLKLQNMAQILLMVLTFAGLSVIGGLSILTFTKSFGTIFLGTQRQPIPHKPQEVSTLMLVPQYVIIIAMFNVALFPQVFLQIIGSLLQKFMIGVSITIPSQFVEYSIITQHISLISLLFIGVILLFWGIRAISLREKSQTVGSTWGCGYNAGTSKMQYTGKSFSKSLSKTFNFIVIEKKNYKELNEGEQFPGSKEYESHYHDFFEFRFIRKTTNRLIYSANYFKFIQNGRIQSYVFYGIAFIITIFVLTLFKLLP